MANRLDGRVALVTDGRSGIGLATAEWRGDGAERLRCVDPRHPCVRRRRCHRGGPALDAQIAGLEAETAGAAPAGRAGTPEEIAGAVLFLVSADSSDVAGIELFVDGGLTQGEAAAPGRGAPPAARQGAVVTSKMLVRVGSVVPG